jgi:hypothetical protein
MRLPAGVTVAGGAVSPMTIAGTKAGFGKSVSTALASNDRRQTNSNEREIP